MENNFLTRDITSLSTLLLIRLALLAVLLYQLKEKHFLSAAFLLFIILIIESAHLWSRIGLRKLTIKRRLTSARLFPDEETTISLTVENNKKLSVFLTWIQPLPPGIEQVIPLEDGFPGAAYGYQTVGWHSQMTDSFSIKALKRGYYRLPTLRLQSRDVFGLFFRESQLVEQQRIFVYPRLLPMQNIKLTPADLIGLQKDSRPFLPDPIMFVGLREYTPEMPARFIHWKASAHKGQLLAKIIEPSADLRMCIALDAEAFLSPEPQPNRFEEALSLAATLAMWADMARIPFGLLVNAPQKELAVPAVVSLGSGFEQIRLVLESLARVELAQIVTLNDLLRAESSRLPWGTTLVIIGGRSPETIPPTIRQILYYSSSGEAYDTQ